MDRRRFLAGAVGALAVPFLPALPELPFPTPPRSMVYEHEIGAVYGSVRRGTSVIASGEIGICESFRYVEYNPTPLERQQDRLFAESVEMRVARGNM